MLVLSRKKNEKITIGDDIEIMVIEIRGDKVRLGIEAPKYVPVHRSEVWQEIIDEGGDVAMPLSREVRLCVVLQNFYDDVAAGNLDAESFVAAGELLEELGVTAS